MMEKIRIGGIKGSGECLMLQPLSPAGSDDSGVDLVRFLAEAGINILFLSLSSPDKPDQVCCCVAGGAGDRACALLASDACLDKRVKRVPSVGLLSLFPHQNRLKVLGLSLYALGKASLPILGMNSSLSALTFIMDYRDRFEAVEVLGDVLDFPREKGFGISKTAAPMGMETSAVYREPRIKTYGFDVSGGLSMLNLIFPQDETASWGARMRDLETINGGFRWVMLRKPDDRTFRFLLLIEGRNEGILLKNLMQFEDSDAALDAVSPVDLVSFHGPHFGDRDGIAYTAFRALESHAVPILASGCSVSHVYLILPEKRGKEAAALLGEVFEIPGKWVKSRKAASGKI